MVGDLQASGKEAGHCGGQEHGFRLGAPGDSAQRNAAGLRVVGQVGRGDDALGRAVLADEHDRRVRRHVVTMVAIHLSCNHGYEG